MPVLLVDCDPEIVCVALWHEQFLCVSMAWPRWYTKMEFWWWRLVVLLTTLDCVSPISPPEAWFVYLAQIVRERFPMMSVFLRGLPIYVLWVLGYSTFIKRLHLIGTLLAIFRPPCPYTISQYHQVKWHLMGVNINKAFPFLIAQAPWPARLLIHGAAWSPDYILKFRWFVHYSQLLNDKWLFEIILQFAFLRFM